MGRTALGGSWLGLLAAGLAIGLSAAITTAPAHAARRHALLIGVDKYDKRFGIEPLNTAGNDADALAEALKQRGIGFTEVVVLKDEQVRDKATFDFELDRFLAGVGVDDEVLLFLSGHGVNVDGRNLFLLPDAKSQAGYLDGKVNGRPVLDPATRRSLDTKDKQDASYRDWISRLALDEKVIEDAILGRKIKALVIIADTGRAQVSGSRTAVVGSSGFAMPRTLAHGVLRLHSAGEGQLAYGAPEFLHAVEKANPIPSKAKTRRGGETAEGPGDAGGIKLTSLFMRVLLSELPKAYKSFGTLAEAVRQGVVQQSVGLQLWPPQVPDYGQGPGTFGFKLVVDAGDLTALCRTAPTEYQRLLDRVLQGGLGTDVILRRSIELDPCGWGERVLALLKFERLGTGFLAGQPVLAPTPPDSSEPSLQCDYLAGSPHDKDRPQVVPGAEITRLALLAAISGQTSHDLAVEKIERAIRVCESAVRDRPRVDRNKFNLGRSYYAMATVTAAPLQRQVLLEKASRYLGEAAVDLGYAAAYNFLGQLYLNGEYHEMRGSSIVPVPPDREMAVKLLKRGAALNDVLANYNLGMAYKNGESGLAMDAAEAFPFFSRAAEAGFVPAMVETAHALLCGCGVASSASNERRAFELLEDAAKRGSSEAMTRLGNLYKAKGDRLSRQVENDGKGLAAVEYNNALVWYARAAELGDALSQETLADMLTKGVGVPSAQPEAAGRYWRLAAEGGSVDAQLQLADLIRRGTITPRPLTKGKTEHGAQEIRDLYSSAFARGKPRAGLELARLYRKGYPELLRGGSEAIPREPGKAIKLLWDVMGRVRTAPPDSDDANPEHEAWAAFELIDIYDKGEHRLADGTRAITEDEIARLKADFGNPREAVYIRVGALGPPVNCPSGPGELMVLVWNSKRAEPQTDRIFDWFERRFRCKVSLTNDKATRPADRGISKATRDAFRREHAEALKSPGGKSYVERMTERVARLSQGRR